MIKPSFVSYRRVSTESQGKSGLGLEAQSAAVAKHVQGAGGRLLAEYTEVESGRNCDRPDLEKALAHARRSKATFIIAKLDRLSRNAAFLLKIMDSGVEVVAADNPSVNRLTLQILAVLAEEEARNISVRTKAALAALKARGVLLGSARPGHWDGKEQVRLDAMAKARSVALGARQVKKRQAYQDILPLIRAQKGEGKSFAQIAGLLNDVGHTTRHGKQWTPMQVLRVLKIKE